MKRIVIAIQFYEGDRAAAFRLAQFITDIEPTFRDDVELCFVNRFDCKPITPLEMVKFITTFKVSWFQTTTQETGHPAGCNAMARDFFAESLRRYRSGEWAEVQAVLLLEPDCVPVARDWINQLEMEWDFAKATGDFVVVGCYRDKDVDVPHINGNALWAPDLAARIDLAVDYTGKGWDSALAHELKGHWFKTSLISNLFKETNVPTERLANNPFTPPGTPAPVLIHGVKDESAWDYAKAKMGPL